MKVSIVKTLANSETITIETMWDGLPETWDHQIEPILARLDRRLHEKNLHILAAGQAARSEAIPPDVLESVAMILRMVNGVDLHQAVARLEAAGIPI
jgi:hypothetical protein